MGTQREQNRKGTDRKKGKGKGRRGGGGTANADSGVVRKIRMQMLYVKGEATGQRLKEWITTRLMRRRGALTTRRSKKAAMELG